ncbi:MAG: peptide chain release factor 2 [Firmicutes bacterium]|nr:peptide chain release factor 2 [Bacillota bacterium]
MRSSRGVSTKWGLIFDVPGKLERIGRIEAEMNQPGFWGDQAAAQVLVRELSGLKRQVEDWSSVRRRLDDLTVLAELAREDDDPSLSAEVGRDLDALLSSVAGLELRTLLSGEYDRGSAIVAIHPGAGGTESQDWAQMLLRMYTRWAERRGYAVETLDLLPGDEAGIKSVTLLIKGEYGFGYLQAEKGVHRLVRISPFDASGRRHTSFASVDVLPEVETDTVIQIDPTELRIDTYRSSGAGGQHVNKTESAIRITHMPTGIVVACQTERSQHSNRETAMRILKAKLLERLLSEHKEKIDELRGDPGEIAWGNQIRSYVFCPYTMVKDHRTGTEKANVSAVMDGDIDEFIEAYLRRKR